MTTTDHVKTNDDKLCNKEAVIPTLEALTAACGEKILNPDFLLQGGGQPFADQQEQSTLLPPSTTTLTTTLQTTSPKIDDDIKPNKNDTKEASQSTAGESISMLSVIQETEEKHPISERPQSETDICIPKRPVITLYSRKMKGIKDLLLAEKLNTHAISLQVTAQSQVQVGGKKNRTMSNTLNYAKRSRRQ